MKIHRPLNRNGFIFLLAFMVTGGAGAAITPTEWQHRQSLSVAAPGLVRVSLPATTFDAAGPKQADLRIIDASGREVALLLDRPPTPIARTLSPEAFELKMERGASVINLTTGTEAPLKSVVLATPHRYFLKSAAIEISDDQKQWTTIDRGAVIFRQWGAEQLELQLKKHRAAFVRITINNRRGAALPFTGARLNVAVDTAPQPVEVGARIVRRDEFSSETVLTLELEGKHVPLAALAFATNDPLFMRRVTLSVRVVRDTIPGERTVGSGTIYRVALDGAPAREQLELPLNFTPETRELLVHIHNGDSPPLAIDQVRALRQPVDLLFMAPTAGPYKLLSGNTQVEAPRYDLAAFAGEMRTADAVTIVPGALTGTVDFQPRETLAAPPLKDVHLYGAPLDTADWSLRRDIRVSQTGVQELELDAAALAQSLTGFDDLRIMQAGNQLPYVLEQPTLARALKMVPVVVVDPKRPSLSMWKLELPQAGLPISRIGLASTTALFERQIRIFERLNTVNGHEYENNLASGAWSRTPEPGVPETRVFDLNARPRSNTIWIESDNGDNPAIELGAVQVIHPVVRLIFKAEEIDGYALAYGNKTAVKPRYDLRLVAERLLTASRQVAQLAPDEENRAKRNPFANLNGGYVFWGALALVVIGLLVVVAKLLPKPPSA